MAQLRRAAACPRCEIALNEPRNVTVTLESPEPLANAEVRVELRGALALDGTLGNASCAGSPTSTAGSTN